jgi:hypothetical protein
MKNRWLIVLASLAAASIATLVQSPLIAQQAGGPPPLVVTAYNGGPPIQYTAAKTPWGEPDLQGVWSSDDTSGIPMSRPQTATGLYLTDEQWAARRKQTQQGVQNALNAIGTFRGDYARRSFRQTSLVVDPPDGRAPAPTEEARKRAAPRDRGTFGNGPFDTPEDFTLYDRCITRGVPGAMFPAVYNATTRIVQSADAVAITYEMIHETRVIPLEPLDKVSGAIRDYLGIARGHWQGNTLVVETTNFNGKTVYRGASEKLRMVERFTRLDKETLRYEVTLEDTDTWPRPWTAQLNLRPRPEGLFEYACHEGNYGMRNMLSAARAAEKEGSDGASR